MSSTRETGIGYAARDALASFFSHIVEPANTGRINWRREKARSYTKSGPGRMPYRRSPRVAQ